MESDRTDSQPRPRASVPPLSAPAAHKRPYATPHLRRLGPLRTHTHVVSFIVPPGAQVVPTPGQ
jgi:hypothetical protein